MEIAVAACLPQDHVNLHSCIRKVCDLMHVGGLFVQGESKWPTQRSLEAAGSVAAAAAQSSEHTPAASDQPGPAATTDGTAEADETAPETGTSSDQPQSEAAAEAASEPGGSLEPEPGSEQTPADAESAVNEGSAEPPSAAEETEVAVNSGDLASSSTAEAPSAVQEATPQAATSGVGELLAGAAGKGLGVNDANEDGDEGNADPAGMAGIADEETMLPALMRQARTPKYSRSAFWPCDLRSMCLRDHLVIELPLSQISGCPGSLKVVTECSAKSKPFPVKVLWYEIEIATPLTEIGSSQLTTRPLQVPLSF